MSIIPLQISDLFIAATLVLLLAGLSVLKQLDLARVLIISACRAFIQLLLVGYVLHIIFELQSLIWILGITFLMLLVAGHEVMARQHRKLSGWWGFGAGTLAMFLSSFCVMLITLTTIIHVDPWYHPQYLIPLMGMLLGNTMNGIALSLDRLLEDTWNEKVVIEARLAMGHPATLAISGIRRKALRSGMMPLINAMAVAGIVSLPGMMTGQMLAGASPLEAAKYQILIFFLIAAGTGFGALGAVSLACSRLFDERDRLRLERLHHPAG